MKSEFFPKMTHSLMKLKMNMRSRSTIYLSRMFVIYPDGWISENLSGWLNIWRSKLKEVWLIRIVIKNRTTLDELLRQFECRKEESLKNCVAKIKWLNFETEVGVVEELENVEHLRDAPFAKTEKNSLYFCQYLVLILFRCGSHQKGSMCAKLWPSWKCRSRMCVLRKPV